MTEPDHFREGIPLFSCMEDICIDPCTIEADRLRLVGSLTGTVSHEINNPNTCIMLCSDNIGLAWGEIKPLIDELCVQSDDDAPDGRNYRESCDIIERALLGLTESSRRIAAIVRHLRDFARGNDNAASSLMDIATVVESSLCILQGLIKKSTYHCEFKKESVPPSIWFNASKLQHVIVNLVSGSCGALRSKDEKIALTLRCVDTDTLAEIEIVDQGSQLEYGFDGSAGISPLDPDRFSRESGIIIASSIMHDIGGTLQIVPEYEFGTKIMLHLPVSHKGENLHE